jgi:hypothetical protein
MGLPIGAFGGGIKHLCQSSPCGSTCPFRQGIPREKTGFDDFTVRLSRASLLEAFNQKQNHMIPPGDSAIEIDPQPLRRAGDADVPFLQQFHGQTFLQGLPPFHTAAGQVPAGNIGVPHKEDAPCLIPHNGAGAQRHPPACPEPEMEHPHDNASQKRCAGLGSPLFICMRA